MFPYKSYFVPGSRPYTIAINLPHRYLSVIVRGTDSSGRRALLWKILRVSLSVDKRYLEISLVTRMYILISARRRPVCVCVCVCVCYLKHYLHFCDVHIKLCNGKCLTPIAYVYKRSVCRLEVKIIYKLP